MFQNSRNFAIFGGIFNAIQVVPDVADQSVCLDFRSSLVPTKSEF